MTDGDGNTVAVCFVLTWIAMAAMWFVLSERIQNETRALASGNFPANSSQELRCHNAPTPRVWTKETAEGYMLKALVAAETAEQYGGSMPHKLAWAMQSIAWSGLVERCWK